MCILISCSIISPVAVQRRGAERVCCVCETRNNFPAKQRSHLSTTTRSRLAIKVTLQGGHDKPPKHAEQESPGKGKYGTADAEDVLVFERKLTVFGRDVQRGTLFHFPSLRKFKEYSHINCDYLQRASSKYRLYLGKDLLSSEREKKNTLTFNIAPLDIDPSLLNMSTSTGVKSA